MKLASHGWLALALSCCLGCGEARKPDFSEWSPTLKSYEPVAGSSNGFDDLAIAAVQAKKDVRENYLDRVYFTPKMRSNLIAETRRASAILERGLRKPIEYRFVAYGPFEQAEYHIGWRLLGRALIWRTKEACESGDFDRAIANVVKAHRFGFGLCQGSALEASLGMTTVDEARREIAPYLGSMTSTQLKSLAASLGKELSSLKPLDRAAQHEGERMMMAVLFVEDCYRKGDFEPLSRRLGLDSRDAIRYLEGLKSESVDEQETYFQGFSAEAEARKRWAQAAAAAPLAERTPASKIPIQSDRPWRRFAKHFFTAFEPVLGQFDRTLARTRMLAIECHSLAAAKASRSAPASLDWAPSAVALDPYSGMKLNYRSVGTEFTVYSVGEDLADDGGKSDESFSTPDLLLERPAR